MKNSEEAIFQIQPVTYGFNTSDAIVFVIPDYGPGEANPVYISDRMLQSFQNTDLRKTNWTGATIVGADTFYFPNKYKSYKPGEPSTEYLMVLRLSELYLIRAEARTNLANLPGALDDINTIRRRAGLEDLTTNSPEDLIDSVFEERKRELFSEWGHRWFDLKRTKRVDEVMSVVTSEKGGTWDPNWQLYPVPLDDLQKDNNLSQNSGY